MRSAALAAALAIAAPAAAEPSEQVAAEVAALLQRVLVEQRVFVGCSVLDPAAGPLIRDAWVEEAQAAARMLRAAGYPDAQVDAFVQRAQVSEIIDSDARFGDMIAMCTLLNPTWSTRYAQFDFIQLTRELEDLLGVERPRR
ncbi:MAG: hypothetical protein ACFBRM_04275 [Pikeienuella sp.]